MKLMRAIWRILTVFIAITAMMGTWLLQDIIGAPFALAVIMLIAMMAYLIVAGED